MKTNINKSLAVFLQVLIVLIGICAITFMLWEPHLEGRNVNSTVFEVYFKDPFLAVAYTASIAFFVALYQAFKVLGYAGRGEVFSQAAVKAMRIIKYCGTILVGFALAGEAYLFIVRPEDDIAGGVFMGLLMIVGSGIIAIIGKRLERKLQNGANPELLNSINN